MGVTAKLEAEPRWFRTLQGADSLADDLGVLGTWVGPRTGPLKRTQGDKEDYIFRRLVVAWKEIGEMRFPVDVRAAAHGQGEPDFELRWPDGRALGVEVTEAGREEYQAWLTRSEVVRESGQVTGLERHSDGPTKETVSEIMRAIESKVRTYDEGFYRGPDGCDLVVYDNTEWGGFLDKSKLITRLGRPNDVLGRFKHVHLVTGETVHLDLFEDGCRSVDTSHTYEIDYARWIFDQVEHLRQGATDKLDRAHIAEELEDLGRSERRALGSHLRVLSVHLLKWEFQPERRSDGWLASIDNARSEIHELLTEIPSLRRDVRRRMGIDYVRARRQAGRETGLPLERFPEDCPYEVSQLLDPEFLPGSDG